jgi:hypothetical protein
MTGLDVFRKHFEDYKTEYVVFGGTACYLLLQEVGLELNRITKDLDIVLCVEALSIPFVKRFWEFVREAGYEFRKKSTGEKCFYRFEKPQNPGYPYMLELLSNKPEILSERESGSIVPMSVGEDIVSLSAILLNEEYYGFIKAQHVEIDGLIVANEICIIPLKIRAWIDLTERQLRGESVSGVDIKKHKNDVYRITQLVSVVALEGIPQMIRDDILFFVDKIEDQDILLKQLKIPILTINEIKRRLLLIYCS